MSKYSDNATIGGQVLAHRVRMMRQIGGTIYFIGKCSFLMSFFGYLFFRWKINDIWNYLCIVKAIFRTNMSNFLPYSLFSNSFFRFGNGRGRWISDYVTAKNEAFSAIKDQFEISLIFGIKLAFFAAVLSMIFVFLINKFFGKSLSDEKELIRGSDYVDAKALKNEIKKSASDITLAGIPYPKNSECRHTIITGTTGSGKTNVFHEILQQTVEKNERAIIVDTVGTYVDDYFRLDCDVLLNPLDYRSKPWNFLDECAGDQALLKQIADCIVTSKNKNETFWDEAARIVLVESVKKIISERKKTKHLLRMLEKPAAEWQEFLKNTCGASLMDKDAEKMAISIRATLINDLACFKYLNESDSESFSIRKWIESGKGFLFFSCTPKQRNLILPIIKCWITGASQALLQIQPTTNRTWFLIDEFHNLGRLPNLETTLAEVRKFGGCFVFGTQMISQLNDIYSPEVTRSITGLCGTKVVMNVPEPTTAKYMSGFLGEKEEISVTESISYGANTIRDGVNIAQQKEIKNIVPASEIMNLKTGEAFVRFSGVPLIGKVKFEYHEGNIEKAKTKMIYQIKNLFCKAKENPRIFGEVLNKEQYMARNGDLFGDFLQISGLNLSEKALKYPLFWWADKRLVNECIGKIIDQTEKEHKSLVIIEDGCNLYSEFAGGNDILLNPFTANGYGWNFAADFKNNSQIAAYLQQNLMIECSDYSESFKNIAGTIGNSSDFSDLFCFSEASEVEKLLQQYVSIKNTSNIRAALAKELDFLHDLPRKEEISLCNDNKIIWISCFGKPQMRKLSRFILETLPLTTSALIQQSDSHEIKRPNTIIINAEFNKFHTRFDGSFLASGNTENNDDIANLFGKTTQTNIFFAGKHRRNINTQTVSVSDLSDGKSFFRYAGYPYNVLKFQMFD